MVELLTTRTRTTPPSVETSKSSDLFRIVVHHDLRHTFRYCKSLLIAVFGLTDEEACEQCWTMTTQGQAVVWIGKQQDAERYCQMVNDFQATLDAEYSFRPDEQADAGYPPLRTTIESLV
jgi:ATP-dependent Clp protease adapter protein ClpS